MPPALKPAENPASSAPLLRIEGLSVEFGAQGVLRDIHLDVPRGQTLAVIGESGCGKTVLLKSIIGLLTPTRGKVSFDGQDLAALGQRELSGLRVRFGFLFQQAALFDSMSVEQNISFPLRQHTPRTCSPRNRPNSPAGCANAWAWPGPWPWSRKSCSTTSPPPAWTRS
jgi:ABC-type transporter Mla maintaining outer membrane lipid asymmetry ATPase subunit MlaF